MKIAIVITAKNEARILRSNILYHKAIGVCKAFVYFDNTTDNGKSSISDVDIVEISHSVVDKYRNIKALETFNQKAKNHHTARQCLNTYDALQKSKTLGIDWLISLDADELVITDKIEVSDLKRFFGELDDSVDLVNFEPYEILQNRHSYNNVFAEALYFKTTHKFSRRIDQIYKSFYNPFDKRYIKFSFWYGQHLGKAALKVNSKQEIIPKNVHRYTYIDGNRINSVSNKGMLHYHMFDAKDFIKKFKNFKDRPNYFLSGNKVDSLKLLCRDIVNSEDFTEETLIAYYKSNIMFSKGEVKKMLANKNRFFLKRKEKAIIKITSVIKVFSKINS
jgi:hypothetical protein